MFIFSRILPTSCRAVEKRRAADRARRCGGGICKTTAILTKRPSHILAASPLPCLWLALPRSTTVAAARQQSLAKKYIATSHHLQPSLITSRRFPCDPVDPISSFSCERRIGPSRHRDSDNGLSRPLLVYWPAVPGHDADPTSDAVSFAFSALGRVHITSRTLRSQTTPHHRQIKWANDVLQDNFQMSGDQMATFDYMQQGSAFPGPPTPPNAAFNNKFQQQQQQQQQQPGQDGDDAANRGGSEEDDSMTPAQSRRKAQNRAA